MTINQAQAQPTAFEVDAAPGIEFEVFKGLSTASEFPEVIEIALPRYGCVTVAEELEVIRLYSNVQADELQIELDVKMARLLLQRSPQYCELNVELIGKPLLKSLVKFFMDERREHKPEFSETQEESDSPKAGANTEPDSSPPTTESAMPSAVSTRKTKRGTGKTSPSSPSAA